MSREILIADLFSGAGGAAYGLHLACEKAGIPHKIVGVDIKSQPHYPAFHTADYAEHFEFIQADALAFDLAGFDAVWASPPCQYYTRLRHLPWLRNRTYWRSIPPTREHILSFDKPFIIENVADAAWDMIEPIILCGASLGMNLYRHRAFETTIPLILRPPHRKHIDVISPGRATLSKRHHGMNGWNGVAGHQAGIERHRMQMGIPWMTGNELAQAVPPIYAQFLGEQLVRYVKKAHHADEWKLK